MAAAQLSMFPEEDTSDSLPSVRVVRCRLGDLWALGRHRLVCGDCTDAEQVTRLMSGKDAQMLISDPPYGMRLDTDFSSLVGTKLFNQRKHTAGGHKYRRVSGDMQDYDASIVATQFCNIREQFWFGADYYAATLGDTSHQGAWLVWDKRLTPRFDRMFGSCFELVWSRKKHKRDILRHVWAGIFGTEHEISASRQHPTQKPLALIEDLIKRYSKVGWLLVDPYLGSGTTLIACERTQRTCYGLEIEPRYCDVILSRWEKGTGKQAELLERIDV